MKNVHVSAAIILKGDKIFITQRGYGEFKDFWEFPGGKIEQGETKEEALKREIREELKAEINITDFLTAVSYDYESFHLEMECFLCSLKDDHLELVEAEDARFASLNELKNFHFLPADVIAIDALKEYLSRRN